MDLRIVSGEIRGTPIGRGEGGREFPLEELFLKQGRGIPCLLFAIMQ